ncbi:tripartite tricarboxylate transporter TctB family protein [Streptomyces phaeolivaceus]|uniref:tripartite tricarboxylate transporter TctB family protein n=1 Tax=Streptomyces phaeolivaceus TaxID=2653200 RepID=UPI001869FDAA|nr:tripartite tricarboxylate transporter TctB family protein [Streptomyces phaeolivaceus]
MSTPPDESWSRPHRADVTAGLVVAAAGVGLFLAALRIEAPPGGSRTVGPSAFPVTVSLLLALSGLVLAGRGVLGRRRTRRLAGQERTAGGGTGADTAAGNIRQSGDSTDETVESGQPPVPWRRLALMIALFAAYVLAFIPLGQPIATTAYLLATSTLIERERWLRNGCFAVVLSVAVHLTFTRLLGVELPAGLLG